MCHHSPSQQLQVDAATLQICLQLFAQSGLEKAAFADMETLSNHMGLFLQVPYTSYNVLSLQCKNFRHKPACQRFITSRPTRAKFLQSCHCCPLSNLSQHHGYLAYLQPTLVLSCLVQQKHICFDCPYVYAGLQFGCLVCMHC